jgi:nucleotide-binding universal stress UspA family protein
MYAHVLVGTDGSPTATRAVGAAARLAHAHGARLTVVHAFDPRPPRDVHHADRARDELGWRLTPGGAADVLVRDAADHAQAVACGALDVHVRAEPGHPVPVLLRAVAAVEPDAVVVGNADLRRPRVRRAIGPSLSRKAGVDVIIVDTTTPHPLAS